MANKPTARLRLEIGKVLAQFRSGIHRSIVSGRGMEVKTIRPYDPSDSPSSIDHMVSARVSEDPELQPMSRVYYGDKEISVVAFVDAGSTMALMARKREQAEMLMWLFALSAFRYGDRFRIIWFGNGLVRDSDWIRDEDILQEQIARNSCLLNNRNVFYSDVFSYGAELGIRDAIMIVISDFAFSWERQTQTIRRFEFAGCNVMMIFFMIDEWSDMRPSAYAMRFYDHATGVYVLEDMRHGSSLHARAKAAGMHLDHIEQCVKPLSIPCIRIPLLVDALDAAQRELVRKGLGM